MTPTWQRNDKKASVLIFTFSIIVFLTVVALDKIHLNIHTPFDAHIFAKANAVINSIVAVLLVAALAAVKRREYVRHKNLMLAAMVLSVLFLVSYIAHHLLAGETKYGGAGALRGIYFFLLMTHIPLAAIILPFILFTAYRGLTGDYERHKKLARVTWPIWFYVAVTGPLIYFLISPYYT